MSLSEDRLRQISLWISAIFCLQSSYTGDLANWLIWIPGISMCACAMGSLFFPRFSKLDLLTLFAFAAYAAVGSLITPSITPPIFTLAIIFACAFPASRRQLWFLWVGCLSAIVSIIIPHELRNPPHDQFTPTLQVWALFCFFHLVTTKLKIDRKRDDTRFTVIGKHAARITHDVKGMLTTPKIYLEHLHRILDASPTACPNELEMVKLTQTHLNEIQSVIGELSRLASVDNLPESRFSQKTACSQQV
ncbi:MAG: hemolysin III family protein [Calothrix sp. SM1_5_4]|nr:hemolysin III family protein [Calothrix sp. SM1_5_4]